VGGDSNATAFRRTDGEPGWSLEAGDFVTTVVGDENQLYIGSQDGSLRALRFP